MRIVRQSEQRVHSGMSKSCAILCPPANMLSLGHQ